MAEFKISGLQPMSKNDIDNNDLFLVSDETPEGKWYSKSLSFSTLNEWLNDKVTAIVNDAIKNALVIKDDDQTQLVSSIAEAVTKSPSVQKSLAAAISDSPEINKAVKAVSDVGSVTTIIGNDELDFEDKNNDGIPDEYQK